MAIFDAHDWSRLDYFAIVNHGLASIADDRADECRRWLGERRYQIISIDCAAGFSSICNRINDIFRWEHQFGYAFNGGLDALHDGFDFEIPDEGGLVLELQRPDVLWDEKPDWAAALLEIASEHSRQQLAVGKRFFVTLILPPSSDIVGKTAFAVQVPWYWALPGRSTS